MRIFAHQIQKVKMKKIRLPQPYAQMVVSGVIRSIPNVFQDIIINSERVYVYADYFETEWLNGFDIENELHQRVWNETILGNIPDRLYPYDCFIGSVVVTPKLKANDRWIIGCNNYLGIKSADEFEDSLYMDDFNVPFDVLANAKVKHKALCRMTRADSRLYIPLGESAWEKLKYPGTACDLFLFWEDYMSEIVPLPYLNTDEIVEIDEIIFQHNGQKQRFDCDSPGWNVASLKNRIGKFVHCFIFAFMLELQENDTTSRLLIEYAETVSAETECLDYDIDDDEIQECKHHYGVAEYRNPWPHFISVPMGGQNKWKRH